MRAKRKTHDNQMVIQVSLPHLSSARQYVTGEKALIWGDLPR